MELLIALLIMAVIAAIAIGLFGGILNTSKGSADRETAETIKKAILTYMNASGDAGLKMICTSGTTTDTELIGMLDSKLIIAGNANSNKTLAVDTGTAGAAVTGTEAVLSGTYGPFLDSEKNLKPQQESFDGWVIKVHSVTQRITVESIDGTVPAVSVVAD